MENLFPTLRKNNKIYKIITGVCTSFRISLHITHHKIFSCMQRCLKKNYRFVEINLSFSCHRNDPFPKISKKIKET